MLLDATTELCVMRARDLCATLGAAGPIVMMALAAAAAALFERYRRFRVEQAAAEKLEAAQAAAAEKLAAAERAAAEKLAVVKAERNQHAQRAQELEVKVAVAESLRPPPMPPSSSSSPSNPPVELVGGDDTD